MSTDLRPHLEKQLKLLQQDHQARGDKFRARAYQGAIQAFEQSGFGSGGKCDFPIREKADLVKLADMKIGLAKGGSIFKRLEEMLDLAKKQNQVKSNSQPSNSKKRARSSESQETDNSSYNGIGDDDDDVHADVKKVKTSKESQILLDLTSVHGIGAVRAKELMTKHNITSVKQLQQIAVKQELLDSKSQTAQKSPAKKMSNNNNDSQAAASSASSAGSNRTAKKDMTTLNPGQNLVLTKTELIGLQYHSAILQKEIARSEVQKHVIFMQNCLNEVQEEYNNNKSNVNAKFNKVQYIDLELTCTGSFRRGEAKCGDIDVVVTARPKTLSTKGVTQSQSKSQTLSNSVNASFYNSFLAKMEEKDYIRATLARSGQGYLKNTKSNSDSQSDYHSDHVFKFMGVCSIPSISNSGTTSSESSSQARRIDVLFVPAKAYPFALVHFTGNKLFNIELRNHALSIGYSLSEHGLNYVDGKKKLLISRSSTIQSQSPVKGGQTQSPNRNLNLSTSLSSYNNNHFSMSSTKTSSTGFATSSPEGAVQVTSTEIKARLGGEKEVIENETDVFRFLGFKYIDPTLRKVGVLKKYALSSCNKM